LTFSCTAFTEALDILVYGNTNYFKYTFIRIKRRETKKKKKLVREAENSPILMYSKLKLLLEKYALVKFKLRGRMQGE